MKILLSYGMITILALLTMWVGCRLSLPLIFIDFSSAIVFLTGVALISVGIFRK